MTARPHAESRSSALTRVTLTVLDRWLTSVTPATSRLRLNPRSGSRPSGTDLDLNRPQVGECGGKGRGVVERDSFAKIPQGILLRFALAGEVDFETLSEKLFARLRDAGRKGALHRVVSLSAFSRHH